MVTGHKQIIPAIAIDVAEGAAQVMPIRQRDARLLSDVGESAVAVVAEEHIGTVRTADEQIEPTVAVDVGPGTRPRWHLQQRARFGTDISELEIDRKSTRLNY